MRDIRLNPVSELHSEVFFL